MKQQVSIFEVTGTVKLQHDKGVSQEQLEGCIERMFLMLPAIVGGKTENTVYGREVGKREIRMKSTGDGSFQKFVEDKKVEKKAEPAKDKKLKKKKHR